MDSRGPETLKLAIPGRDLISK